MTTVLQRLLTGLPTSALLERVKAEPWRWKEHTWRQNVPDSPQAQTQVIYLRYAEREEMGAVRDDPRAFNWPALREFPEALEVIEVSLKYVRALQWGRTFLVRLPEGCEVTPHRDEGKYADRFERFHICLQAGKGFEYCVQDDEGIVHTVNMKAGELWWFDHKKLHWAMNRGPEDRITMILDAVAPTYRRERPDGVPGRDA